MSILSSLKKLFSKLLSFLKKLLKWLGPLLIVALIVIFFFFPAAWAAIASWASTAWATITTTLGGWLSTAWGWLSSGASGLWKAGAKWLADASFTDVLKLATGAAVILDPEGVADGVGNIIGTVTETVGKVIGPALPWLVGAGLIWLFLSGDDDDGGRDRGSVVRLETAPSPPAQTEATPQRLYSKEDLYG